MGKPPDPHRTGCQTAPLFPMPAASGCSAAHVADLLETLHAATVRLAAELPELAGTPAAVSARTVAHLRRLAAELTPAAQARSTLSVLEPELLLAGAATWAARRGTRPRTAAARARLRWSTTTQIPEPAADRASS